MTDDPAVLHIVLPRITASVPVGRAAVTRWLDGFATATTEDDRAAVRLAVTEALANAVEHGGDGPVTLTATGRHGSLVAVVRDRGRWSGTGRTASATIAPVTATLAPSTAERGRGLHLLRAVVDEVRVVRDPTGTATVFVRHLGAPARATVPPPDR